MRLPKRAITLLYPPDHLLPARERVDNERYIDLSMRFDMRRHGWISPGADRAALSPGALRVLRLYWGLIKALGIVG